MKAIKFLLGLGLMVASSSVFSQGLQGIVVEKYYQADANDVANATSNTAITPLTTNSVTYRVYVDMAAGYKFNSIFGSATHNLTVGASTGFYNDPSYAASVSPHSISTVNIRKNTAMLDSWFTTGYAASGKVGVLKSEDTDGTLGHATGLLANNPGGCFGLPITGGTGQDGFLTASAANAAEPNSSGVAVAAAVLDQTNGTSVVITNGFIAALGGITGATSSNMVLIGQFTTSGDFSFALNVQIQNIATGVAENYVSSNPTGSELTHPTLTYVPNVAPTAILTSVTNVTSPNTNILTGTTMTLTATASDQGTGTVTGVEFFVNNVSVGNGTLSGGVYSKTHVASTPGSYSVTAKATDNECLQGAASTAIVRTIASNVAPTNVTVTAPANTVVGNQVTLTATASDLDGVSQIAQVEFFIGNTSVGVDNISPYSVTITAALGSGQIVKAVATDNGNPALSTTSATVTMNVLNNVNPTVNITSSPASNTVFSSYSSQGAATAANGSLASITLSASTTDNDGQVTGVNFFLVNGTVYTLLAPGNPNNPNNGVYTYPWSVTAGTYTIAARATDNNGGVTTSSTLTFVVDDIEALPYEVVTMSQTCDLPTYCVKVKAASAPQPPVDNVKGYDIVMKYDAAKVLPTGNITLFNTMVNPALVEIAYSIGTIIGSGPTSGTLNISFSFLGSAPASSEFAGSGDLFCAEFSRLAGFGTLDNVAISIPVMQESYITGVSNKQVTPRPIYSTPRLDYTARLKYGFDNSPIVYNPASANSYLVTNVYGSIDGTTISNPTTPVVPNLQGKFTHNFTNGTNLTFQRDIVNTQSIQLVVNAMDATVCRTLLINGYADSQAPSIYQMQAMDVNLDGVVSSGDLTQIKQRATLAIPEFQQAWNYLADGTQGPNYAPSKDFVFVDSTTVKNNTNYTRSSTFPAGNALSGGYWKGRVPVTPFILPANQTGYSANNTTCAAVLPETYKVTMLGDADGSYGGFVANGTIKANEEDYILVDLSNAIVEGSKVSVPVSFVSEEIVKAFDIALQVNENKLSYVSNEDMQMGSESEGFYNTDDKTFRYTAFNLNDYSSSARVSYFTFETVDGKITDKDLKAELGLLNGKLTEVRFTKSSDLTNNNVDIFPNPSNGMFTVMSKVDGRVDIVDVTGKLVHPGVVVKANQMIEVNMPELSAGVYFVRAFSNNSMTTKRIVISE